ncbi:15345_t:CDS:2, partial [Racocetra persica]
TNCIGNAYCDISYKDYMELKNRSEVSNSYFEKEAIHHYELWMQNTIRRVKRAKEIGEKIRAHYKLLWEIREESRQINNLLSTTFHFDFSGSKFMGSV